MTRLRRETSVSGLPSVSNKQAVYEWQAFWSCRIYGAREMRNSILVKYHKYKISPFKTNSVFNGHDINMGMFVSFVVSIDDSTSFHSYYQIFFSSISLLSLLLIKEVRT